MSTKGLTIGFFIADAALIAVCAFFYLQMDRTAPVITLPDTEHTYTTGTDTDQLLEGVTAYDSHDGDVNCSPSSRQLKKYKFFLPAEIYLLAVFMQLASKFHVFPLVSKFQDSFANVCCCSNLYNLRSFLREYFYQ